MRAYADGRGAVVSRALAAPFVLAAVVPAPEEQLIDLSQALSLEDHVTTPDSDDDETILEEEVRAPSPTKRDRTASEEFWDADDVFPWVAPPKTPKTPAKRARKVYCCTKCGRPKKGHLCPFD